MTAVQKELGAEEIEEPIEEVMKTIDYLIKKHDVDGDGVSLEEFIHMGQDNPPNPDDLW